MEAKVHYFDFLIFATKQIRMTKTYLITAGISGFFAVLMGAIGSHFFMGSLTPEHMASYNTAVQMQMYHTLAILSMTFFNRYVSRSYINMVFYLFLFGIILFCIPVYINATTEVTGMEMGPFSFLAPVGGFLLMAGWIGVVWNGIVYVHHKRSHKHD
jgi:uncharacterized membrane protein YgdD (TMEM256/DUF423 family)